MMSTTDAVTSCRPPSARQHSSIGARTAPQQHPQPSLGDVLEEVDDTDIPSPDVTKLPSVVDDSPIDVARPQRRRHHGHRRRRSVLSRQKTAGKVQVKHRVDSSNDAAQFAAETDDSYAEAAANASAADDRNKSVPPATQTSKAAPASPLAATSNEPGDINFDQLPMKQPARHRRQITTKKHVETHEKINDKENEVGVGLHKVLFTTLVNQSSTRGDKRASSGLPKHSKTRMSKRSGTTAPHHRPNNDYQLEMDNPEVKDWLRKKNRLFRKRRAEERRKERQERLVEEREKRVAETRKVESAKKVHAWMQEKLLKQRLDAESSSVTQAEKVSAVIHQTFALESPDRPISVELTTKDLPAETTFQVPVHSKTESYPTTTDVRSNQSAPRESSAPIVYSRSPRTAVMSAENRRPPTKISLPQSDVHPTSSVDNVQCEPGRLSFDDWLAMKRRQDVASRRRAVRVSSRFDEEESCIIRQVARRRIEAILSGRKRVDSGMGNTDRGTLVEYPRVAVDRTNTASSNDVNSSDQPTIGAQHHRAASDLAVSQNEVADVVSSTPRSTSTTRRPMQSVDLVDNLLQRSSTPVNRPSTAFPARRSASPNRTRRPTSRPAMTPRITGDVSPCNVEGGRPTLITGDSFTVKKLQAHPMPKPILKPSTAYRVVKYQQTSWDKFSDHMWEEMNKSEGEEDVPTHRPEPVGSEKPQQVDDNTHPARCRDYLEPPFRLANHDHRTADVNDPVDITQHVAESKDISTAEIENDGKKMVTFAESPKEAEVSDEPNARCRDIEYLQQPASIPCPTGGSDEVDVQNVWNDSQFTEDDDREVNDQNQTVLEIPVQYGLIPRIVINNDHDDDDTV